MVRVALEVGWVAVAVAVAVDRVAVVVAGYIRRDCRMAQGAGLEEVGSVLMKA